MSRYQLAECYMIFGGIPYYLELFDRGLSLTQNVDMICFAPTAPLRDEFEELYRSLFNNPSRHIAVVEALSKKIHLCGWTKNHPTICGRHPSWGGEWELSTANSPPVEGWTRSGRGG